MRIQQSWIWPNTWIWFILADNHTKIHACYVGERERDSSKLEALGLTSESNIEPPNFRPNSRHPLVAIARKFSISLINVILFRLTESIERSFHCDVASHGWYVWAHHIKIWGAFYYWFFLLDNALLFFFTWWYYFFMIKTPQIKSNIGFIIEYNLNII